jgi:hypothetical protein
VIIETRRQSRLYVAAVAIAAASEILHRDSTVVLTFSGNSLATSDGRGIFAVAGRERTKVPLAAPARTTAVLNALPKFEFDLRKIPSRKRTRDPRPFGYRTDAPTSNDCFVP